MLLTSREVHDIRSCRHVAPDIEDGSGYSMGYRCLSNKKNRRTTVKGESETVEEAQMLFRG